MCSENDFKEMGIPIGPRKKLQKLINTLSSNKEDNVFFIEEAIVEEIITGTKLVADKLDCDNSHTIKSQSVGNDDEKMSTDSNNTNTEKTSNVVVQNEIGDEVTTPSVFSIKSTYPEVSEKENA